MKSMLPFGIPLCWIPLLAGTGLFCSSPNENDLPLIAPGMSTPVVTGLILTNDDPTPLAIWGRPADVVTQPANFVYPPSASMIPLPTRYAFHSPYPNPFTDSLNMNIELPMEAVVSVWVVRARWVEAAGADVSAVIGGVVNAPQKAAVRVLARDAPLDAGYHAIVWDGRDDGGTPVEAGFYRIYFEVAGTLFSRDVLRFRSLDDLPQELRTFVEQRVRD